MAQEARDFFPMASGNGSSSSGGDRDMADAAEPAQAQLSASSPAPDMGDKSPLGVAPQTKQQQHQQQQHGEVEPPPCLQASSSSPAGDTVGPRLTDEDYQLFLQFKGMLQQQQHDARLGLLTHFPKPQSPERRLQRATLENAELVASSPSDQHPMCLAQAQAQHSASSPASASASASGLSLAIPVGADGQRLPSGFAHQGGFGSPIPGLHRLNGRSTMMQAPTHSSQSPNSSPARDPSALLPQRLISHGMLPRASSPQTPPASRPCGPHAPGKLTAQLTIFYAGTVNTYNDVPEDKARAIMLLAASGSTFTMSPAASSSPGTTAMPTNLAIAPPSPAAPPLSSSPSTPTGTPQTARPFTPELPQARKQSLARFLEKRKGRQRGKAPYDIEMRGGHATHSGARMSPLSPSQQRAASPGCSEASPPSSLPAQQAPGPGPGPGREDQGNATPARARRSSSGTDSGVGNQTPDATTNTLHSNSQQQQQLQIH